MRVFKTWWLLRKLYKACIEGEEKHLNHFEKHGHHHDPMVEEQSFLQELAPNNKKKRVHYLQLLNYADDTLGLLEHLDKEAECTKCGEKGNVRWIKLNKKGFEFIGFLEFMEFFANKYPVGWGAVIKIATGVIASLGGSVGVIYVLVKILQHALG